MYKLLIVDDEPLVQVGIKSMLNWQELNIEVCATAVNGQVALDIIEKQKPDIVISDVKMPVMDGLELLRRSDSLYVSDRPVFILLTSYEDFHIAKEAIKYRAFDYLVKVELTPETLKTTIQKAIDEIAKRTSSRKSAPSISPTGLNAYKDRFLISLLNNLFESDEQMYLQARDLNINMNALHYLCCYGSFEVFEKDSLSKDKQISLFASSLQMLRELTEKYISCDVIGLDISHFALILQTDDAKEYTLDDYRKICLFFEKIKTSLQNYYNVLLRIGIGFMVNNPGSICESYQYSRLSYRQTSPGQPVFYQIPEADMPHDAFHFSLFRKELTQAFEEYKSQELKDTISTLCDLLSAHPHHYVQALDAASNILYLAITLLPDGRNTLNEIFKDSAETYMSLYRQTTVEQIVNWLEYLSSSLAELFEAKKKDYKNRIVSDVKTYLADHVSEKLSLNEVAAKFGISPSYLSQLFSKYSDAGFNEHINILKIEAAKKMLREDKLKVYEVADALNFGSEFYFSKVFKKVEGISPSEFINTIFRTDLKD